jgi:hypothetical protein
LVGGEDDQSLDSASVDQLVGGEDDLLLCRVSAGFLAGDGLILFSDSIA